MSTVTNALCADASAPDPGSLVLRLEGPVDPFYNLTIGPLFPPGAPLLSETGFFTFHFVTGAQSIHAVLFSCSAMATLRLTAPAPAA